MMTSITFPAASDTGSVEPVPGDLAPQTDDFASLILGAAVSSGDAPVLGEAQLSGSEEQASDCVPLVPEQIAADPGNLPVASLLPQPPACTLAALFEYAAQPLESRPAGALRGAVAAALQLPGLESASGGATANVPASKTMPPPGIAPAAVQASPPGSDDLRALAVRHGWDAPTHADDAAIVPMVQMLVGKRDADGDAQAASPAATPSAANGMSLDPAQAPRNAAAALAAAPPTITLRHTVGTAAWRDELAGRISWMSNRAEQFAILRLVPDNLGPVEVRIEMDEGSTNIWFGAQHVETRAAIETALPRLRELLAQSGLSLGQFGVSTQTPRDTLPRSAARSTAASTAAAADELTVIGVRPSGTRQGLVDLYA